MKNSLVLRQIGKFYNVLDDDCYILFYLFGYKISNYKSGFPVSAFNKVKNELEEKKISFILKDKTGVKEFDFKRKNKYLFYLEKGKEKYKKFERNRKIEEYVNSFSEEKIDKIYKYIESLIDEE